MEESPSCGHSSDISALQFSNQNSTVKARDFPSAINPAPYNALSVTVIILQNRFGQPMTERELAARVGQIVALIGFVVQKSSFFQIPTVVPSRKDSVYFLHGDLANFEIVEIAVYRIEA